MEFVAAPLCGMTLSQLGAEVIRVDPIGGASDVQRWPLAADGTSIYWTGLNKGKRSVTIDLRSRDGHELVQRLIIENDGIVVTNAAGFTWLQPRSPGGQTPRRDSRSVTRARGRFHRRGLHGQRGSSAIRSSPVRPIMPVRSITCCRPGTCAADCTRRWPSSPPSAAARQSGAGARISLALEDVALATAANLGLLTEPQVNGTQRERLGNAIYGQYGQDFISSDGARFMVVTLTGRHFRDLLAVTGADEAVSALAEALGADFGVRRRSLPLPRRVVRVCSPPGSGDHTADEITTALSDTTVLFERYRTFAEVAAGPKVTDNPMFSRLGQPGLGDYFAPGPAGRFRRHTSGQHARARPGARHRRRSRAGVGLSAVDIERLTTAKTIAC